MAKTKSQAVVQRVPPPAPQVHISLGIHKTAHHDGMAALAKSTTLAITDLATHEAVRGEVRGWKSNRKAVEAWYRETMVTPLYKAYVWARDQMDADLLPFDTAIERGDKVDIDYVREQKRIEAAEAEAIRVEAERVELERRQQEANKAEAAALKLEASSNVLSEREQQFVQMIATDTRQQTPGTMAAVAHRCGYKDPVAAVARLMKSDKINKAIANAQKAAAIRREAEAKQAEPIVVQVDAKPSEVVEGGIRQYYSCDPDVDVLTLAKAVVAGTVNPLALSPNLPYLNTQAKALRELFPKAFPGTKLARRDGTVSR